MASQVTKNPPANSGEAEEAGWSPGEEDPLHAILTPLFSLSHFICPEERQEIGAGL